MSVYQIGQIEHRPWGYFEIINTGLLPGNFEFCEKRIVVKPQQILSLQSHMKRHESWTVLSGRLTAIRNNDLLIAVPFQTIHIRQGMIHSLANMGEKDLVIHERQEGICREDDIIRYADVHQRSGLWSLSAQYAQSLHLYEGLVAEIAHSGERNLVSSRS